MGSEGTGRRAALSSLVLPLIPAGMPSFYTLYPENYRITVPLQFKSIECLPFFMFCTRYSHNVISCNSFVEPQMRRIKSPPSPHGMSTLCMAPFQFMLLFPFIPHVYSHISSFLEATAFVYLIDALLIHVLYVYLDIFINSTSIQCQLCVRYGCRCWEYSQEQNDKKHSCLHSSGDKSRTNK